MHGVILAGGRGSRLGALTRNSGKALVPVCGQPMLSYALVVLMRSGLREIVIVTTPRDSAAVRSHFGDGTPLGIRLRYAIQAEPRGIADAFSAAGPLLGDDSAAVILADNLFLPTPDLSQALGEFSEGAEILAVRVDDPRAFGVVSVDSSGRVTDLREKPSNPASDLAVPGFYLYDETALARATTLEPSERGELEITDLNRSYLRQGQLRARILDPAISWLDAGTPDGLALASARVAALESSGKGIVACPEAVSLERGFVSARQLRQQLISWPETPYKAHVSRLLEAHS